MAELARNRRAYYDYEILEKFEAGIELRGYEVKAVKSGRVNIAGTHVAIRDGALYLLNADIPPYQPQNTPKGYEPTRTRKLLLNRGEIEKLTGRIKERGLTVVPLRLYTAAGKRAIVKLEIALVRSKKQFDKRESIKKKEAKRTIERELSR
ncbi:MAG: SsrA-binding protein [Candidatus Colwellbacteria bacterium CG_4_9_14_0_2_um_filter_50_12]|uniref:SsrA-binding protein n=1 Tax=Candidatus Colwellbacteria bacterium CG_4_9_14_0_2_um_filter_50_12 TaxID=1974538 RepID=A0A2M8G157_9BACT|nr:MAG: SsrA-binding protein [Candidatus Colwellbacteria bacterium CG_4_9_14_0_2_um_filter_50_12]